MDGTNFLKLNLFKIYIMCSLKRLKHVKTHIFLLVLTKLEKILIKKTCISRMSKKKKKKKKINT
jgi:hypothetical protein